MAPTSRIILTRHAQAEHNVDLDYSIPDAPLTPLGEKQAATIPHFTEQLQKEVDLIVSSPLKRTLMTTKLGWGPAVERLGIKKVVCIPQAQECNSHPCDTGSSAEELVAVPAYAEFDYSRLTPDWTSKQGFWASDPDSLSKRAQWVRQFLRERPEKDIVLVAHGDVLRYITSSTNGPSTHPWRNAEVKIYKFDSKTVDTDDCFLIEESDESVAPGFPWRATEKDLEAAGVKL